LFRSIACLLFATALSAQSTNWRSQCSTLFFNSSDAHAQCIPGVTLSVPSATEAANGAKAELLIRTKNPQTPEFRFAFGSEAGISPDGETIELFISGINGASLAGTGSKCRFQRSPGNRAGAMIMCSSVQVTFGQVLMADEESVTGFLRQLIAIHNLIKPDKPFAGKPAAPSAPQPIVNTYTLDGKCLSLEWRTQEEVAQCTGPLVLRVPNALAVAQGQRPSLVLQTTVPGMPALSIYLGEGRVEPNGSFMFPIFGVQSNFAVAGANCGVNDRALVCRGYSPNASPLGKFLLRYQLTGDPAPRRRGFNAAMEAGAGAEKLSENGGVKLSNDPKAILGIALAQPLPAGIPSCENPVTRPGADPNKLPFCLASESEGKSSQMWEMLDGALDARVKARRSPQEAQRSYTRGITAIVDPAVVRRIGMRLHYLRINPAVFDSSFMRSFGIDSNLRPRYHLTLIEGPGGVQYVSLPVQPAQWQAVYKMLQSKYGKATGETWETVTNLNGTASLKVPNAMWDSPGLLVEYFAAGRLDVATASLVQRLEALERQQANPAPQPTAPPKRKL
jgi:hypothetical protein